MSVSSTIRMSRAEERWGPVLSVIVIQLWHRLGPISQGLEGIETWRGRQLSACSSSSFSRLSLSISVPQHLATAIPRVTGSMITTCPAPASATRPWTLRWGHFDQARTLTMWLFTGEQGSKGSDHLWPEISWSTRENLRGVTETQSRSFGETGASGLSSSSGVLVRNVHEDGSREFKKTRN